MASVSFPTGSPKLRMTLVSDKKKEIRVIHLGADVRAEAQIGHCSAHLQKIFIESKKSWMISLPEYAEMIGNDIQTGAECRERVMPATGKPRGTLAVARISEERSAPQQPVGIEAALHSFMASI